MKVFYVLVLFVTGLEVPYCFGAVTPSATGWVASLEGNTTTVRINLGHRNDLRTAPCSTIADSTHCFKSLRYGARVTIRTVRTGFKNVTCSEIDWQNPDSRQSDCVQLGDDYWYGGAEMATQRWPIRNMNLDRVPYVTGDYGRVSLGSIIEGMWISSNGTIIFVDRITPLFVSFNQSGNAALCLSASYDEYPYSGVSQAQRSVKQLKYSVCSTDNVREAYEYAQTRWLRKPEGVVDSSVIERPIWSTWARYKKNINHHNVLAFSNEIVTKGFSGSHLEIDDKWEICYGALEFDFLKFPDPSRMVRQIKDLGFNVSLWIHPYASILCPSFYNPVHRRHLIKDENTGYPLICSWWNGLGGYLDTTDPSSRNYFVEKVERIKNLTGIDSFKFDSGEVSYISRHFRLADSNMTATPNEFTREYSEIAAQFGNGVEVRSAYNSQHLPIFVRMLDRSSTWDFNGGLQSLIPTALFMSVIGYPFVLPDMVGGNGYGSLPDRELYIRWLQVNVFMPVIQFSIVPWDYDEEVVNISKVMIALHAQYAPVINQLALEATQTGSPILRPLWWITPKDRDALQAEQQFLLGNDLLVAPIVEQGATARDIYIPEGSWQDQLSPGITHEGPIWLASYRAELHQLPYFTRSNARS